VKQILIAQRDRIIWILFVCAILINVIGGLGAQAPVTFERLLKSDSEPQNWLTYSGSLSGNRYSLLKQITTENVKNLELQWVNQVQSRADRDKWEATPLVVDGVMYTVRPPNEVVLIILLCYTAFARLARTGRKSNHSNDLPAVKD